MEIVYADNQIVVCVKPVGVLSTDEPGGLPDMLRGELGAENFRTVHRLDAAVSGLMLLARTKHAAGDLGRQVMDHGIGKEYLTVIHGCPETAEGSMRDHLWRDRRERKSYALPEPTAETQEALLDYRVLETKKGLSAVRIRLHTGRTHQIRVQFSSRGLPLVGDKKYGRGAEDGCGIALWSCALSFEHPKSGEKMDFFRLPPTEYPWNEFECFKENENR